MWVAVYVLLVLVVTFLLFALVKRNPWFWPRS